MLWSWGVTGKPRGPPPALLRHRPCCAAATTVGTPQLAAMGFVCIGVMSPVCVFFFLSHLNALHGSVCGTGGQVQVGNSW